MTSTVKRSLMVVVFFDYGTQKYHSSLQISTGIVRDEQGKALAGANVTLQRANDSSLVKIAATNVSGQYSFLNIQPGKFFIGLSFVSYRSKTSAPFEVNGSGDITVPEMVLEKTSTSRQDVTIN